MLLRRFPFALATATMLFIVKAEDSKDKQVCSIDGAELNYGLGVTIPCYETYEPGNCDTLSTVEDYERCVPSMMNISARNYLLGSSGRRITYNDNAKAFTRYRILPKMLRDVSESSVKVTTLGQEMSLPIGFSPMAYQRVFDPDGEKATIREIKDMAIPFTLSDYGDTTLEDLATEAEGGSIHLWMGTRIFRNRTITKNIVTRAEKAGYEAIVLTLDYPEPPITCGGKSPEVGEEVVNLPGQTDIYLTDSSATFKDIKWVKRLTKLPIVVKGILSPSDAVKAVKAGASAILVSNHGGRREDSAPATIDVLSDIVDAVHKLKPDLDVYLDGGIRNGGDMYKAIGRGAKMVFIAKPYIYGLVKSSGQGVKDIVNILHREFEEAMKLAGSSNPSKITRNTVIPPFSRYCSSTGKGEWDGENNWHQDSDSDPNYESTSEDEKNFNAE